MSIKNGYTELNADPVVQPEKDMATFYSYDRNSGYLNFNFDETIDVQNIKSGFAQLRFDGGQVLVLDLNIIDGSNSAFVMIPKEYMNLKGDIHGEVYLDYPDNNIQVGRFTTKLIPSMIDDSTPQIAEVYIPAFEQIKAQYDDLKQQFESLGLGTFEDSVKKVNQVISAANIVYPNIKGYCENDGVMKKNSVDVLSLPTGVFEVTNATNIPKECTNHTLEVSVISGSSGKRTVILVDTQTGLMYYRIINPSNNTPVEWTSFNSSRVIWKNDSGNNGNTLTQLDLSMKYFKRLKITVKYSGAEHIIEGKVPSDPSKMMLPLTVTNLYNNSADDKGFEVVESQFTSTSDGTQWKLVQKRRVSIKDKSYFFFEDNNTMVITKIEGLN